ncbi:MAG: hypothetical protein H6704_16490 [Myxococcales bacterium]|nr:hypothetical protein [Myxococcales bacterium]
MRAPLAPLLPLIVLCAAPCAAHAALSADALQQVRTRSGAWAGLELLTGHLAVEAAATRVEAGITALPTVAFGLDHWPTDALGLYAGAAIGLGAAIAVPDSDQTFQFNLHQFEGGARGRYFFGDGPDAPALLVGLGLRGWRQTTQVQRPALLVDRTVAGPELTAGLAWPALGDRLWLRGTLRGHLPFFVRETPTDSGDPQSSFGYGARLEAVSRLVGQWSVQARLDAAFLGHDFRGEGTRASGVTDARTRDRFVTVGLFARYGY